MKSKKYKTRCKYCSTYDSYFAKTNKKLTITTKGFEIPRTNNKQAVGHFKRLKVLFIKKTGMVYKNKFINLCKL